MKRGELLCRLEDGSLLPRLESVYGCGAPAAAGRLRDLVCSFGESFPSSTTTEMLLFSAPGRTELMGNHTDHQRGHGLAASVDMDTIACVAPNGSRQIRVQSRHHRIAAIDLDDLSLHPEETGSSVALVRGVAARIRQLGFPVSGFDAYTTTRVLRGSGLSSSAAFEVLLAQIMNRLFCGGALSPLQLAQVGQYAENIYFGKPCGLLDQLVCAAGGVVAMDFHDPDAPVLEQIPVDLQSWDTALCVIDSRASHADLTSEYAAIPREMGQAAACFGQEVLGQVPYETFRAGLSAVRTACGDRAVLRSLHFYWEEARVLRACAALKRQEIGEFLRLVRQSGRSSFMYLQNVTSCRESRSQPLALLLAAAEDLLAGRGACRVHGGGFAGTIQVYVPRDLLTDFITGIEAIAGPGTCHVPSFRDTGATLLID